VTDADQLVYDRLAADETLTDILTGGVYFADDLPGEGITKKTYPDVWNGVRLKPFAVVKGRGVIPTFDVRDKEAQLTSTNQVIEIWLYNDRDAGYTTIKQARDQIYTLLHERPVTGTFALWFDQELKMPRADELGSAVTLRLDYMSVAYKGSKV
jgi:hypothetical protein